MIAPPCALRVSVSLPVMGNSCSTTDNAVRLQPRRHVSQPGHGRTCTLPFMFRMHASSAAVMALKELDFASPIHQRQFLGSRFHRA